MKKILGISVIISTLLLSGCSEDFSLGGGGFDLMRGLFEPSVQEKAQAKIQDISKPLYSENEIEMADAKLKEMDSRFSTGLSKYTELVDVLWNSEGFYRKGEQISPKETLIDFYLFMEYHKNTQIRNISYPTVIGKELMLVEALFARNAISYLESLDLGDNYQILKTDLITHYKKMYSEEILNLLYEDKTALDITVRMPNIVDRYNSEFENRGLKERVQIQLGIPDSVISRGMGLDLVTLYSGMGDFTEDDIHKLAIILTMEMRISGANMRLEKFFHVAESLDGLDHELEELKKDINLLPNTGELSWVRVRMERAVAYLERLHAFYNGEMSSNDLSYIFIELQVREDFYALSLLSDNIKEVMDKEDYWSAFEDVKMYLLKKENLEE